MVRRKIDVKNLKFVPISEVPEIIRKTKWDEVFELIPRGEALMLTDKEASPETVRSAVRKYKKQGKFTHLEVTTRKGLDGKKVVYVSNTLPPFETQPETTIKAHEVVPTERLPTPEEIFQYLVSKAAFAHTLGEIQEHFFARRLPRKDPDTRALYLRLRERVLNVQRRIERENKGKFESTTIGREKRFTFKGAKKENIEAFA